MLRFLALCALVLPAAAINCGPGQFSNDTIHCADCPANTFCQDGIVTPCPQYSVSAPGSSSLDQCVCQAHSTLAQGSCVCDDGYVLDATSKCSLCPANSFCPDQFTVLNCSNHALSQPGQSSPTGCNACPSGYIQNSAGNSPISCRACLPGFQCPSLTQETKCLAGTFAPPLATACQQCPPNSFSNDAATACTACSAHATAPNGSQSIYACNCDSGYYRDSFYRCIQCPHGVACSSNMALQCGAGTYSDVGQSACALCSQGQYQDSRGASTCKLCPAGASVLKTSTQNDGQAVAQWTNIEAGTNKLYISLNELLRLPGYNITTWQFWATKAGCVVTPVVLQGRTDLATGDMSFQVLKAGTTRNTTAAQAQSFAFSDTEAPYLVPTPEVNVPVGQPYVSTYFGWYFTGDTCIPYKTASASAGQFFRVAPFDGFEPSMTYSVSSATSFPLQIWPVTVGGSLTTLTPATAQAGATSIMNCSCPDNTRQLSNGQCQRLCPDGSYIPTLTGTDCVPCQQGSYCVNSIITACPVGTSSLPGATACQECINPGSATDIQLYTCGLKTCASNAPINLGPSTWMGLGKINVAMGNVNGSVPTPWLPGDTILGMELNPASDRPFALVQRDIDLVSLGLENQQVAFQFRYRCAGMTCPDWLKVEFSQDNAQNFVEVLSITDFTSSLANWVQTATAFFVAITGTEATPVPIQLRVTAQMKLSSCILWLGSFEVVTLGSWQYDDITKLRLLTTDTVNVPRFSPTSGYMQPVDAVNLQLTSATFWVDIDPAVLYPTYQYVASVWAKGSGSITIKVNDADNATLAFNSADARQISLTSSKPPSKVWIQTAGSVTIKGPSLLLRSPVVGCQLCLKDNWCAHAGISNCPAKSVSQPGASAQTDCWCVPGFYGKQGSLVGYTPCTECPLNYFCTGGNSLEVCPNGTKTLVTGATACIPCSADEYCALGRTSSCPDHSTSPIDSWDVTQCICDAGYYGTAPNCVACEPGFYCINGTKVACTDHAVSPVKSWDQSQCFCDRGYEGVANAPCAACPEGSFCWTGVKTACPNNMWSPALSSFQANCSCDYGTYPVLASCSPCSPGTYKPTRGVGACTSCDEGTYSLTKGATSSAVCIGCAPGTYTVGKGQYQCQACPAGYYSSSLESSSCKGCWPGSYSVMGSSVCTTCMAGTFSRTAAASSIMTCQTCDIGSWSSANSTACSLCGACPYWKYPATIFFYVQSSLTVFADTDLHYKFAVNNLDNSVFMAKGTSVYSVDLKTGNTLRSVSVQGPSPTHWWFAAIASSVLGNYLYVIQNQDVYRVDLSMGSYDIIYSSKLASCIVEDSTQPDVVLWIVQPTSIRQVDPLAAIDIATYSISGANYVCVNPVDPDHLYVTGTFGLKRMHKATGAFATLVANSAFTVCQVTPDGNFIALSQASGKKLVVYSIFDGTITPVLANAVVSGILVTDTDLVLGIDAVGVHNVSYSFADSRTCGPGQYGDASAMTSSASCKTCTAGNICPGGANVTSCAPGTYSVLTGLRDQRQCTTCPAGSYCPGATCPPGYDCHINPNGVCAGPDCTDGDNVHTCFAGSYSMATGLSSSTDCPLCAAGYYCPDTLTQIQCPNNTFSSEGSNDLSSCRCTPGIPLDFIPPSRACLTRVRDRIPLHHHQGGPRTDRALDDGRPVQAQPGALPGGGGGGGAGGPVHGLHPGVVQHQQPPYRPQAACPSERRVGHAGRGDPHGHPPEPDGSPHGPRHASRKPRPSKGPEREAHDARRGRADVPPRLAHSNSVNSYSHHAFRVQDPHARDMTRDSIQKVRMLILELHQENIPRAQQAQDSIPSSLARDQPRPAAERVEHKGNRVVLPR